MRWNKQLVTPTRRWRNQRRLCPPMSGTSAQAVAPEKPTARGLAQPVGTHCYVAMQYRLRACVASRPHGNGLSHRFDQDTYSDGAERKVGDFATQQAEVTVGGYLLRGAFA